MEAVGGTIHKSTDGPLLSVEYQMDGDRNVWNFIHISVIPPQCWLWPRLQPCLFWKRPLCHKSTYPLSPWSSSVSDLKWSSPFDQLTDLKSLIPATL